MNDIEKKILEWREMAEKDPKHRTLLTDAADRLEKIYKERMDALPKLSEDERKKAIERGWRMNK